MPNKEEKLKGPATLESISSDVASLKDNVASLTDNVASLSNLVEDVLLAMNEHSTKMDGEIEGMKTDIGDLKTDMKEVKQQLTQMVTKDYLDKRVSEMKGESIGLVRKEDDKLATTVEMLGRKDVLSVDERKTILAMEPFPKVVS